MKNLRTSLFTSISIFLLFSIYTAFAANIPNNAPYPGGIAVVPLSVQSAKEPKVYFNQRRVLVKKDNSKWVAIVGLPLAAKAGIHQLRVKRNYGKSLKVTFDVKAKRYPLRHITIKDKSKVTPNPQLAKRIRAQTKQMRALLSKWNYTSAVPTAFILPVKGRLSSGFGIRRIYNKVKRGRHTGLDIAAPTGTAIVAAANGRVLAVHDYVITGNTVFVDHGQGLVTYYCHMNSTVVKPGERITQGEKLGTVGSTGRVTGPHVHWGVVLNGVKVNPLLFVSHDLKRDGA